MRAFFSLLRSGLWEKDLIDLSSFPLSQEEWLQLYAESCRQTVQGIMYRGLNYLSSEFLPPQELLIQWVAESVRIEKNNRRTEEEIIEIDRLFSGKGITLVLKKGQSVATLYEYPALRVCGDIDLFFRTVNEYKRANKLIRDMDIGIRKRPDGSREYNWQGIEVEHHPTLIDLRNPFIYIYLRKLEMEKGFDLIRFSSSHSSQQVRVPSPLLDLLMLNTHIMKHTFISGIGLRQLCDMARAYYRYYGKYEGEELKTVYRKSGILKWTNLLHNFLTENLGLEEKYLPYRAETVSTEKFLKAVMLNGNFGQYVCSHGKAGRHFFSNKMYTVKALYRNRRISLDCGAFETFCWTVQLIYGQIIE